MTGIFVAKVRQSSAIHKAIFLQIGHPIDSTRALVYDTDMTQPLPQAFSHTNTHSDAERIRVLHAQIGDAMYDRDASPQVHYTASAWVLNTDMTRVLLAYHRVFDSYGWLGGHADGETDLTKVSLREATEESGLVPTLLSSQPVAIRLLNVPAHDKNGKHIAAHQHGDYAYAWIADDRKPIRLSEREHKDLRWVDLSEMDELVKEKHMLPLYHAMTQKCLEIRAQQQQAISEIVKRLPQWYRSGHRDLPWRNTRDPYRIWVSEILLQQTRVQAVIPAYQRFVQELPDVAALAACDTDKLMKLWEGMGYYRRAANLQRAAQTIMVQYDGIFPDTYDAIASLSGIGSYTAGAIASIAYGLPTPAVDGNVIRVFARVCERYDEADKPAFRKEIEQELARRYPQGETAGELTQSLMELGATVCLPSGEPQCACCPLQDICMARCNGVQRTLPVRVQTKVRPVTAMTVVVMRRADGRIALRRRPASGLLAGQWELPHYEGHLDEQELAERLTQDGVQAYALQLRKSYEHIFTHREWQMLCYILAGEQLPQGCEWHDPNVVALPTAFRKCLSEVESCAD